MVAKIRNLLFIAVMCVGLCSVIGYVAFSVALPDVADRSDDSALENRSYTRFGDVLAKSFVKGKAQGTFEQYVADNVPARDEVLLFNAGLQRKQISASAKLFGFNVYPTFYGSKVCVVADQGMLTEESMEAPDADSDALNAWVDTLNAAVEKHPDVRFSYVSVCETRQSSNNPTYPLMSGDLVDRTWVQENIIDRLDERMHAKVIEADSVEEIRKLWFPTDTHCTLAFALRAYNEVASQLGLKEVEYKDDIQVLKSWYGVYSRKGLNMRASSTLRDMPTDFTHLKYFEIVDDKKAKEAGSEPGKRQATLDSEKQKMKQTNPFQGYTTYYGTFNGMIRNDGDNNGKNCLLIGDSFTHCLKRYVADNYAKTYSILPGNFTTKWSLEKYIKKYKIDDVIVITQALKYNPVAATSPKFVSLDKNAVVEADDEAGL